MAWTDHMPSREALLAKIKADAAAGFDGNEGAGMPDPRATEIALLREAIRTPFASTLSHEAALERLREINVLSYGGPPHPR